MRRLAKRKPDAIKSNQLRVAVSIGARFAEAINREVARMVAMTERDIRALFERDDYAGDYGMDANIGSQARIAMNRLLDYWNKRFADMAQVAVAQMQKQVVANSGAAMVSTLKMFSENRLTLNPKLITGEMKEMLTASAAESTALIKSIPQKYLGDLGGSVMRSIVSGNGLADLVPELAQHKVSIRNWAKNTALDQTRKVYTHTNIERLKKAGIKQFEWIHSGGGLHPRKLHQEMNGKIYDLDNPPVIGTMYGEEVRGFPSDLPNCHPGWSGLTLSNSCKKLYRRRFNGELTKVITDSGEIIESTPNHPILTNRGWIAANQIEVGDYLFHAAKKGGNSCEANKAWNVTTASDLFDAFLSVVGRPNQIAGFSAFEFHGDVSDGEIDIIDVDSFLPSEFNPEFCERISELMLAWADENFIDIPLLAYGPADTTIIRMLNVSDGIVSRLCAILELFRSHSAHAHNVRLGLSSYIATRLDQPSSNCWPRHAELFGKLKFTDPGNIESGNFGIRELVATWMRAFNLWNCKAASAESLGKIGTMAPNNGGNLLQTGSGIEQRFGAVKQVIREKFDGHVYNLETVEGWYMSDGIITHNCRCVMVAVLNFGED